MNILCNTHRFALMRPIIKFGISHPEIDVVKMFTNANEWYEWSSKAAMKSKRSHNAHETRKRKTNPFDLSLKRVSFFTHHCGKQTDTDGKIYQHRLWLTIQKKPHKIHDIKWNWYFIVWIVPFLWMKTLKEKLNRSPANSKCWICWNCIKNRRITK